MDVKQSGEKSIEEICQEYKLTEEENKRISDMINENMLAGKTPQQNPVAIIDLAPPGSGKTALNGYALTQFENDNLIIVNNDELKPFHPKADEIARLYANYYTKVTNQESKIWTDNLMDKAIEGRFNVLYEGTGRKIDILLRMIKKMKGYKIIVRAMAVNELNCLMSIIERYEGQIEQKGWGRIVSEETFYKAYNEEMLNTIDTFEKEAMVDVVEVYMRGKPITQPIKIYSSQERQFESARQAIISGRKKDFKSAKKYYEENFRRKVICDESKEETEILNRINSLCQER